MKKWGLDCNCQHDSKVLPLMDVFVHRTVAYSICILRQTAVLITDCPNFNVSSRNGQSVSQIHIFSLANYREYIRY